MRLPALARRARRARTSAATMASHMKPIPKNNGHLRAVTVSVTKATDGAGATGGGEEIFGAGAGAGAGVGALAGGTTGGSTAATSTRLGSGIGAAGLTLGAGSTGAATGATTGATDGASTRGSGCTISTGFDGGG